MPEIVVLAWGPLVRDPGELILKDGEWHDDGPVLPIELSRIAGDRSMTLALRRGAEPVRTLWAYMGTDSVGEAVWSLARREGARPEEIGYLDLVTGEHWFRTVDEHLGTVREWAEEKNRRGEKMEFILWSDLKPNFERKARRELNAESVLWYLQRLRPEMRDRAREYLENIPDQVRTPIMEAIELRRTDIWQG